jgi:hypothetical protein
MQGRLQVAVVASTGHCIQEDRPDEVIRLLSDFARRNSFGVPFIPPPLRAKMAAAGTPLPTPVGIPAPSSAVAATATATATAAATASSSSPATQAPATTST